MKQQMTPKLKVCGMKFRENIEVIHQLSPDYLGFIFYAKSPRYVVGELAPDWLAAQPINAQKVGVFVNEEIDIVLTQATAFGLDLVQLHGQESPQVCQEIKETGMGVIKVFAVGNQFDFQLLEPYKPFCDFFLFDTQGKLAGGNGVSFNWDILQHYDNEIPFFLSGGIGLENIEKLLALQSLNIQAIDINSRFELAAGLKDVGKVKALIQKLIK